MAEVEQERQFQGLLQGWSRSCWLAQVPVGATEGHQGIDLKAGVANDSGQVQALGGVVDGSLQRCRHLEDTDCGLCSSMPSPTRG